MHYTTVIYQAQKALGISIHEYCYCDIIFILSNNPRSRNKGYANISHTRAAEILGVTKQTIMNMVGNLKKKGLIATDSSGKLKKTTFEFYNTVHLAKSEIETGKKFLPSDKGQSKNLTDKKEIGKKSLPKKGKIGKKSLPYNNSLNYKSINNKENQDSLFPESEDSETFFSKSLIANQNVFLSKFKKEVDAGVDVMYYYHSVNDWCETLPNKDKRKRRTAKGWIATARNFMRDAKSKGQLKMAIGSANVTDEEQKQYLSI